MIDYEKLQESHEMLIKSKIHATINHGLGIDWRGDQFAYVHLTLWDKSREPLEFAGMDELIQKLQELTAPKPKYLNGWYIDGFGKMDYLTQITQEDIKKNDIEFYSSKEQLIQAQIDHWTNLLEDESQEPCQHESDGAIYCSNPPKNKCKKCGEFYR